MSYQIKKALLDTGFLVGPGAWAIVDGQFGSTGKGLAASVLAEHRHKTVNVVTSNAGPNSGHTSYFGDEKIVLQQLPTFAVHAYKLKSAPLVYMNAGAILDTERLFKETDGYLQAQATFFGSLVVDPNAAVVSDLSKRREELLVGRIGSTGKGTGAALAAKVMREPGAVAVHPDNLSGFGDTIDVYKYYFTGSEQVLVEVSQGFSLSLNASMMYPYTTSRDCTVTQAIADAGIHPSMYRDCMMVVRTFPIRVAGNSGPGYEDQKEISWDDLGVEPELTTVTKKVRRVFTWSIDQFQTAVHFNRPSTVFVNFMNYLAPGVDHDQWLIDNVVEPYRNVMNKDPVLLLGYGPRNEDVKGWRV